jgi:flagellar hook-associated protein 3 FlgL
MRITSTMSYLNLLQDINRAQERAQAAQNEVSLGKKVSNPSDDPTAAADTVQLSSEGAEADQYARNVTFAQSKLQVTDGVLDDVQQMVERVSRTLGQASLADLTTSSANITELNGLRDQILSAANTTYSGRFIFGGSVTTTPPYVKNPDSTVSYNGNSAGMSVQVTRTTALPMQVAGRDIFSGSVNIYDVMSDLSTAIQNGDKSAIDDAVNKLGQFDDNVSTARSKVGGYPNLATDVQSQLSNASVARVSSLLQEQDADLPTEISEMTQSQQTLQAAHAVGARVSQLSILDFLQ